MPIIVKQRRAGSSKRHTWPRSVVEQLETIPESPPTLLKATFDNSSNSQPATKIPAPVDTKPGFSEQAQILLITQHLQTSIQDRETLSKRIADLEKICSSQAKSNAALIREVRSWQQNYDTVEAELLELAAENEEAKRYVRALETSNANLRYALAQMKEERDRAESRRWRNRLGKIVAWMGRRWCRSEEEQKQRQDRSPSRRPILRSRASDHEAESGRCSRMSSHPQLLGSSPSRASEKDGG